MEVRVSFRATLNVKRDILADTRDFCGARERKCAFGAKIFGRAQRLLPLEKGKDSVFFLQEKSLQNAVQNCCKIQVFFPGEKVQNSFLFCF